jgi:molybdopterin/thiamine biosynthesis adenylyltransferase
VVLLHLALPDGHALRQATGGDARGWLALGVVAGLVAGYGAGLSRARSRAAPVPAATPPGRFSPAELDRYARHIMLREIGGPGQRQLRDARVLVVGAGGLGSPALLYLAAAGVGTIGVIDDDRVENANLARQIIHADARIGMPKVFSAEMAMKALNPFVTVRPYHRRLDEDIAPGLFADHDLILDGSDNFDTRYLVNRVAVATGKPLIAAAITQWEGQISLYHPATGGPCYACLFPDRPAPGMVPTCAEAGVAGPLPGVIGAMMAMEAVKHLTGAGETLRGRLMIHDALYAEARVIAARRRPDCAICGTPHPAPPQAA